MEIPVPAGAEPQAAAEAASLPEPDGDECLVCYVARMVRSSGCDTTLRWALRWRDTRLPRATGLERRLERRGAFCDCELFWNGWALRPDVQVRDDAGELQWPEQLPGCTGVDRRSSQPCGLWEPWRRPRW